MNLTKSIFGASALALLLSVGALAAHAQDQPQEQPADSKPKPAARSNPVDMIDIGGQDEDNNLASRTLPDTTSLTGAQQATLGSQPLLHSFWVPGFQYASQIQSRGNTQTAGWVANNYFIANLGLLKAWRHSQLALNYSGGGFISTDSSQGGGQYQQFAVSQAIEWNRFIVQVLDEFSYLPAAQFGFGGGSGLGVAGVGGGYGPVIPSLGSNFVPNQSIYASKGPRYSNATVLQVDYSISRRSSITAVAAYGLLSFVDPGNVDSRAVTASLGYNHILNRESTIGLVYAFSAYQYPGEPQAYGNHTISVAYSRKLAGRLALQLSAGPQITTLRVPVSGSSTDFGENVTVALNYAIHNGSITAGYLHGLSGGSGVYTGSTVDQPNFGITHKFGRTWSGAANLGFAYNRPLPSSAPLALSAYKTWYVGGGLSRPLGRNLNFAITYSANISNSNVSSSGCMGVACSTSPTTHYITVNFQWHTRPFVLE